MNCRIQEFSLSDSRHFRAAEGWFELGDMVSANDELDEISPEKRAHPTVLYFRSEIYFRAQKWDMLAAISPTLTEMFPKNPDVWVNFAYATRRKKSGSVNEAKEILLEAEPNFPRDYRFSFNLSCYYSQLHQFEESQDWLKKAMAIDEKIVQKLAIDDVDLKPLWNSMSNTIWKRI
jgi:tetratricopeptide (TPR) repeat protein